MSSRIACRFKFREAQDFTVSKRVAIGRAAEDLLGDPVAYVVSLNLRRRHLNESQRARIAADLANLSVGRPVEKNPANLPLLSEPPAPAAPPVTQAKAAELLNVSERSVRAAVEVRDHAVPELDAKVQAGEVSVSAATDVARLPQDEQREIVTRNYSV